MSHSISRYRSFRLHLEALEGRLLPANYTVVNTSDCAISGCGSLRQAILDANANSGLDTIDFSIGSGVQTITPLSPLPAITDPVNILGYSQPGFLGTPIIELDGSNAGAGASGLVVSAGSSQIWDLVINRFDSAGIDFNGVGGNLLIGNFLGTDVTGTAALGNSYGIRLNGSNGNSIGIPGGANLISGNTSIGVYLISNSSNNTVQGNFIGTNASGTGALGNSFGVILSGFASNNNTIGGSTTGSGNLISGNSGDGVNIEGVGNQVFGNRIGTNDAGTAAVPNGRGIFTSPFATNTAIGGTSAAARNIISGNAEGIFLRGTNDVVMGNYIGTDTTGTVAIANSVGIEAFFATGAIIGGTTIGARNIISGNSSDAVFLWYSTTLVQGNYIGTDVSGTIALGNTRGIYNYTNAITTIGGTASGAGNLISSNGTGIIISGSSGCQILGNRIGTNSVGTTAIPNYTGIYLESSTNNTVGGSAPGAGNLISGNAYFGIVIRYNSSGNQIEGNYIGTDVSGTLALGNGFDGILIDQASSGNIVGGQGNTATNVLSGNGRAGVHINGSGSTNNSVIHNRIGTDVSGTSKLGNGFGVLIDGAATNNLVGGTSVSDRNIISGNKRNGVAIGGNGTDGNRLEGNYIGTDWSGGIALANTVGVNIFRLAKNNVVGGTSLLKTNVISGNTTVGISIRSNGTIGNLVQWNYIGTDPTGNSAVPNGVGVFVADFATSSLIVGNGIEFNNGEGVVINNAVGNQVRTNVMRGNGSLGIRLTNNGNNLQPYPSITSVTNGGGSIAIFGTLLAAPNTTYALEFFSNPVCDGSGFGEGENFLGTKSVMTNGSGSVSFGAGFNANVPSGSLITSTATSPTGDTSQFSACFLAPAPPPGPPPVFELDPRPTHTSSPSPVTPQVGKRYQTETMRWDSILPHATPSFAKISRSFLLKRAASNTVEAHLTGLEWEPELFQSGS